MRAGGHSPFRKVNEFLAVERNHSGTLRESLHGDVEAEITPASVAVRSGSMGSGIERSMRWHHFRRRFYFRLYTLFLVQSLVPDSVPSWAMASHARSRVQVQPPASVV